MLVVLAGLSACADRVPIEDGARLGEVEQIKDWFTSVFAYETDDGVVLFDAGFREGALLRKLDDRSIAAGDVTDVFLTHGHRDHLGLIAALPNARVYGLQAEARLVEEESDGEAAVTHVVEDGQIVEVGAGVEVFAVPGHTAGSAAYLVQGVLILGDSAIVDRDGRLVPVNPKRSDDPDAVLASMRALADRLRPRAEEIAWLAPAHSAPLRGFGPLDRFGGE